MPSLQLRFKKSKDAPTVLTFVRADGTHTTQRIGPNHAYGPVHDLAHYVVESVLGFERAFLGLCAEGWTIEETGDAHGLPPEAYTAEVIAGHVSRMEMMHHWDPLAEFNWAIAQKVTGDRSSLSQDEYDAIWRALRNLRARWNALGEGGTFVLEFEPGRRVAVDANGEFSVRATA